MTRYHAYYAPSDARDGVDLYRLADGTEAECTSIGAEAPTVIDVRDLGPLATDDPCESWVRMVRAPVTVRYEDLRRHPDDAVMLAEEELRDAMRRKA